MQLLIEVKGNGFHINAALSSSEDAHSVLALAEHMDDGSPWQDPGSALVMRELSKPEPGPTDAAARDRQSQRAQARASRKAPAKAEEKAVEAAPAPEPPPAPPAPVEAVEAAPAPVNGHAMEPAAFFKTVTDACYAAMARNRPGVQALLAEFGLERFRDIGNDIPRIQAFYDRVVRV